MLNPVLSSFQSALQDQSILDDNLTSQLSTDEQTITDLQNKLKAVPPVLPAPKIFDNLQYQTWLVAGGTVANTGGVGNTATFQQTVPGVTGLASRKLIPNGANADQYSFLQLGADFTLTKFRQEGLFLFPTAADAANSQAVEFDLQQCDAPGASGLCFNWGVQFDFAESLLRVWNRSGKTWVSTGTSIKRPVPGAALFCQWDVHRDATNIYYDSLQINGVVQSNTATSFPAPQLKLGPMLNYGFQLDGEKVPNAYTVLVDRMKLTGWVN